MKAAYLIILSLIGLAVSVYILYTKKYNKKLFCPGGKDCDAVVRSKYGKTFGIENTIFGILYYGLILIYALLLNRNVFIQGVYYVVVIASFAALLFSIYLTFVQAFVLKKWCYYCIISSIASLLIFLLVI